MPFGHKQVDFKVFHPESEYKLGASLCVILDTLTGYQHLPTRNHALLSECEYELGGKLGVFWVPFEYQQGVNWYSKFVN